MIQRSVDVTDLQFFDFFNDALDTSRWLRSVGRVSDAATLEGAYRKYCESLNGEHSPPKQPKPRTQPCYVCDGFGSRASDEAYMMMHTEPCTFCKGTGKLDMVGRALIATKVR
mgnify:CR=1 FL=1